MNSSDIPFFIEEKVPHLGLFYLHFTLSFRVWWRQHSILKYYHHLKSISGTMLIRVFMKLNVILLGEEEELS